MQVFNTPIGNHKFLIKIMLRFVLFLAVMFSGSAYAINTSDCLQYGGKYQCVKPDDPKAISDWWYSAGNALYTGNSLAEVITKIKNHMSSAGQFAFTGNDIVSSWREDSEPSYRFGILVHQYAEIHLEFYNVAEPSIFRKYDWYVQKDRDAQDYTCPQGTIKTVGPHGSYNDFATTNKPYGFMCYKPKPPSGCSASSPNSPTPSSVGNPCSITTGNKFQPELDFKAQKGLLQFKRMYNSLDAVTANSMPMGMAWTHNYNLKLIATADQVTLNRADGRTVYASKTYTDQTVAGANGWFISRDLGLKLSQLSDGSWQLQNIKTGSVESYDINGRIVKIIQLNGQYVSFTYTADVPASGSTPAVISNQLTSVTDNFGQKLTFAYNANGLISSVALPHGKSMTYTYDTLNRLTTVTRPSFGTKTYVYSENTTVAPSANLNLLTGIIDEKGARFANFAYNNLDQGILTEHAGGAQRYVLNHSDTQTTVTDPRGLVQTYNKTTVSGSPKITGVNRGSTMINSNIYDAAGNVTQSKQFGRINTYVYDLTRNLEISRTEAVGTPQERTITTQWSSTLPVPTKIIEAGRETSFTYDAKGNMLTKKVWDKTDSSIVTLRVWNYTYNSVGQILSETTPSGEKTSYSYDAQGNLASMTNPLGFVTTYSGYNLLGQPTLITSPTGQKTAYTYDDAGRVTRQVDTILNPTFETSKPSSTTVKWAQWLIDLINSWCTALGIAPPFSTTGTTTTGTGSISLAASYNATTNYVYDAVGQLTKITLPDGEVLNYSYDDAHRLIGATDSLGNSTSYTLNAAGDITETAVTDPTGNIKLKTKQVIDQLGRVQQIVGNNGQSTNNSYDNFDNLTSTLDALNRSSSSSYDSFNRKITDVDALGQTVKYSYNALDQLQTVTDARGNSTTYTPNAFGENTSEINPDTGTTTRSYTNGRLVSVLDSMGIAHAYTYDTAGRMIKRTDGTGTTAINTTFGYDAGTYGKGLLTLLKNENSEIHYNRNSAGLVVEKTMAVKNSVPLRVQYQYSAGGKLLNVLYPSGNKITYTLSSGKITALSSTTGGTLLQKIQYAPTGITGWTWGTGTDAATLNYDLDGRLTNVNSTGILGRTYTFDTGNRISTIADILAGIGTQTFEHDKTDRLTKQTLASTTLAYTYDANSNRTSKTTNGTVSNYVMLASSNRISGNGYLATGQITKDAVRTYNYDAAGRSTVITKGITSIYNTYDALGQRIAKKTASTSLYFMYDENGNLLGEYDQNRAMVREYIWLNGRIVGMLSKDVPNTLLRVHTDHLGTPRAVSSGNGTTRKVLWRFDGDAFGDVLPTNPTTTKLEMPIRMAGQYFDSEVGTFYNYFRDYDPASGRYVESDPIGLQGGVNTYGYVLANPLAYIDPLGLISTSTCAAIGGAVGGVLGGLGGGVACSPSGIGVIPCSSAGAAQGALEGAVLGASVCSGPMGMAAPGNQVDTGIQSDYNDYASGNRQCGKDPDDRCKWLEDNAWRYDQKRVKATQKAWGCRRSRWS